MSIFKFSSFLLRKKELMKKMMLICLVLVFLCALQSQAYEPPKGITWDMTVAEVDSILGVEFASRDREWAVFEANLKSKQTGKQVTPSKPDFLETFYLHDWEFEVIKKRLRDAIQLRIDSTVIDRIILRTNAETRKLVYFEMRLESTALQEQSPLEQALITKYGKPTSVLSQYQYVWKDANGSEIQIENKFKQGFESVPYYIFVVYTSPEYYSLKRQKEMIKKQRKAARRNR